MASMYSPNCHHPDSVLMVPSPVLTSLNWWLDLLVVCADVPFSRSQLQISLVSDTSALGWGLTWGTSGLKAFGLQKSSCYASLKSSGQFIWPVRHSHFTLQASVCWFLQSVMFYLSRQGGARSSPLCREAVQLWEFCIAHSVYLEASHLPGA